MSRTIDIPGGTAVLRDPGALTERYRRPLKAKFNALGPQRMKQIITSNIDDPEALAEALNLTEHESFVLLSISDAVMYALVESWTLDRPLPATPDGFGDLPGPLFDALEAATAQDGMKILGDSDDGFSVDNVEDPGSPTGASAG